MIKPDKYYSIQELADILKFNRKTIIASLKVKNIPFLKIGTRGQYRILGKDIIKAYTVE